MLKVNFKDGSTLEFNLARDDDLRQWQEWSSVPDFQGRITGVGIVHCKRFMTVPLPKRFRRVRFYAELVFGKKNGEQQLIGERLTCHADETKFTLLVYTGNPPPPVLCRFDVEKIGKQMFPGANIGG
jgi:hypothetical protein